LKLTDAQSMKMFPNLLGARRFIVVFSRTDNWCTFYSTWNQSTRSHPVY